MAEINHSVTAGIVLALAGFSLPGCERNPTVPEPTLCEPNSAENRTEAKEEKLITGLVTKEWGTLANQEKLLSGANGGTGAIALAASPHDPNYGITIQGDDGQTYYVEVYDHDVFGDVMLKGPQNMAGLNQAIVENETRVSLPYSIPVPVADAGVTIDADGRYPQFSEAGIGKMDADLIKIVKPER